MGHELETSLHRLKEGSPGIISPCEVVFCFSGLDTTTNTILTPNLRSGLGAYLHIYDVAFMIYKTEHKEQLFKWKRYLL